ncbi:adenosine receptor A3-like [Stylophora pistillata]|uniref:adenosine receptor A3-like n=1 Tax=Stylophora pistillata TaxID=50429 RepID=UPI000C04F993|nr:adenosine receptor A3-like [Stylophora pistillata]
MANATRDLPSESFFFCANDLKGVPHYILLSLNLLIAVTSFSGNLFIIVVLQRVTSIHPPSKLLFSSLAFTDLFVGVIVQPLSIVYFLYPEVSKLCSYIGHIYSGVGLMLCGVSMFTATAISVDRCFALMLGVRYRHYVTKKRIQTFMVASWLANIGNAVSMLYNDAFAYTTVGAGLLCLTTSVFSYVKIHRVLRNHQTQVHQQLYFQQPNRREIPIKIARYRKTVSSALWVSAVMVSCYLPYVVITSIVYLSDIYSPILLFATELAATLVQLNSSLNPLLYCWKIREVRRAATNLLKQFLCS